MRMLQIQVIIVTINNSNGLRAKIHQQSKEDFT
nr:MAG TPA: hypothetical protein [Caudoviricetes sp.]